MHFIKRLLSLLSALFRVSSCEWAPTFSVVPRKTLSGSLKIGHLMKRQLPSGDVVYREMTDDELIDVQRDEAI